MGRRLASYNGNTFKYNADGKRIEKNGIKYYYDSQGRLVEQSNNIVFLYDTTGLFGFKYYRAYYIYKKDIQGNIIGILNDFGREVVTYSYDAWGNFKIGGNPEYTDIAELNPFRYSGYYYDVETGLYYLQSRYYDPELGRFMTIDSINYADPETINGLNLYVYCSNNPVTFYDPSGHFVLVASLTALFGLGAIAIIETQFHPIETAVETVGDFIGDLVEDIAENISNDISIDIANNTIAGVGIEKPVIDVPEILQMVEISAILNYVFIKRIVQISHLLSEISTKMDKQQTKEISPEERRAIRRDRLDEMVKIRIKIC